MKIRLKPVVILLSVFTILSSCKNTDSDSDAIFPESFQKVWQDETFDDGDEIGVYFTENEIYFWDYDGDDFDQGEDCYFTGLGGTLLEVDGNVYTVRSVDPFTGETEDAQSRIVVDGDSLRVQSLEENESATFSDTGLMLEDLAPSCLFKAQNEKTRFMGLFQ